MHAPAASPSPRVVPGHGSVRDEARVEGVRLVDVYHPPALSLGGHAHDTAKICILLEGGASERCGFEVSSPGTLTPVFRPARTPHANQYHARGARSLLVEIDPSDALLRASPNGVSLDGEEGNALASRLVAAFAAPRASQSRLVRAALAALLEAVVARSRPRHPAWLERARESLFADFVAPPRLVDLARTLGVHPVHLAQSFRTRWGMTTREFVRAHRVFHAMQLVERGAPLADAAAAAGFADQAHMTRAVRRARGAPPGALRRAGPSP
jgi:AraC family transcriptional regulator